MGRRCVYVFFGEDFNMWQSYVPLDISSSDDSVRVCGKNFLTFTLVGCMKIGNSVLSSVIVTYM